MAYKREKERAISSYIFTSGKHKNIIQHAIKFIVVTQLLTLSVLWIKQGERPHSLHLNFPQTYQRLSRAHTVRFFKSPLGLYLSDCTNMMTMSHYGISFVINVRLYDSQDELKMGARKKTCPKFYIINPYMSIDWELHCMRDRNVGFHEKYMNGGNNGVFKKNSVCSSHPHENSGATSVYI